MIWVWFVKGTAIYLRKVWKVHEKGPYPDFFWFVFSRIRTEYGEIRIISPYSVQMWKNTDQRNSEYRHYSRSVINPFHTTGLFYTPLKTSENLWFFWCSQGVYKKTSVLKRINNTFSVSFYLFKVRLTWHVFQLKWKALLVKKSF